MAQIFIHPEASDEDGERRGEVERRSTTRIEVSLPVRTTSPAAGTIMGVTRDVSLSGAYFYLEDVNLRPGESTEYVLQLPAGLTLSEAVWVLCFGTLTRVEQVSGKSGAAVKVHAIEVLGHH